MLLSCVGNIVSLNPANHDFKPDPSEFCTATFTSFELKFNSHLMAKKNLTILI